jgi:hypothetical protein
MNLFGTAMLSNLTAHKQLSRGQAHCLSEIFQRLADLYTLLLNKIVLNILELYKHLLRINLSLLQLLISIFFYPLQMSK